MKTKNIGKTKEKKLTTYLSLDYSIGLFLLTIISIIIGFFAKNNFFYRLGLIFLIATPVMGILISILYNGIRKKLVNVFIGIAVFLILITSSLIGFFSFK